jgi:creatinine amidohydrolase/Fe(II)-dependent formamide hydrolase-like protein
MTRIKNPHTEIPPENATLVQARLSEPSYHYLFKRVLIGHGIKQAVICNLIEALYQECLRLKIPPTWEAENEQRIGTLLERTNFHADTIGALLKQHPDGFIVDNTGAIRPNGPRRTNRASPVNKT